MVRFVFLFLFTLTTVTLSAAIAPPEAAAQQAIQRGRLDAAQKTYEAYRAQLASGKVDVDTLYRWSIRWLKAEIATKSNTAAALLAHKTRMNALSDQIGTMARNGLASSADLKAVEYYRVEADLWSTYNATYPNK
ncbi:MAG: hypothetical protein AAFS10_11860 [Myxococcota bacterium]